jgi:ectoine hydroxylase-related dioxygenase (phytanoyl-CoA dioxygenase family)
MNCYRDSFERDGFVVLEGFLDGSESDLIKTFADKAYDLPEVLDSYMKYYECSGVDRKLARFEYFRNFNSDFKKLLDEKFRPCVEGILGKKVNQFKDKMNWKLPGGGAFKAHQDHMAWSDFPPKYYVTLAIPVDNCTAENGCLEMVRGRHKEGIFDGEHGTIGKKWEDEFNWESLYAKVGDIILFDSFVPHRSGPNVSNGSRRVIYLTYNLSDEGDYYEEYFASKRKNFPPDFERKGPVNLTSKYNLANPIN